MSGEIYVSALKEYEQVSGISQLDKKKNCLALQAEK
jgi:hypothetical protein